MIFYHLQTIIIVSYSVSGRTVELIEWSLGGDTIRAQLELVKYPEIIKVMKQLEKEGFFWSEETPKANSLKKGGRKEYLCEK